MLPITVGLFIAQTICSFQQKAPLFILSLLLFEAVSNLASVWYAFVCGHTATHFLPDISLPEVQVQFSPLWTIPCAKPAWWSADKGVLAGLLIGCFAACVRMPTLHSCIKSGKEKAEWILTRIFSRLIPLFILGFVARMYKTHLLEHVCTHFSMLLIWLVACVALYIAFLFLLGSGGSFQKAQQALKNLLPAGGIAFTSGCSLSTMPWTIAGAGKNVRNSSFAEAVIPATTNIQQIGDCIINSFLCFLIFRQFFGTAPEISTWVHFSVVFVLARFATAAVLGGAIFIMLPIYESCLSFNAEMIALILAFNVILDPLVTSSNVVANGALCQVFEKVWLKIVNKRVKSTTEAL
jgi:Na+/H+-dicarboxylate symporter